MDTAGTWPGDQSREADCECSDAVLRSNQLFRLSQSSHRNTAFEAHICLDLSVCPGAFIGVVNLLCSHIRSADTVGLYYVPADREARNSVWEQADQVSGSTSPCNRARA